MGVVDTVKREASFKRNAITKLPSKDEILEENFLMKFLSENVFPTIKDYLKFCTENGDTRNKSLTLNTLELVRKFLTFDIVSLTNAES